jgi:hypothetical protein
MRIDFESSGGLANLQLNYHVDTDKLPQEQANGLLSLVKSSGVFDLQQSDIKSKTTGDPADVFSYRLSLADGANQKTLSFNDVTAPASLQPLLALLRKLALEQKSRKNP